MRIIRVAAMLFAACLLVGVPFHLSQRATHGQQREKRLKPILSERGVLESGRAVDVHNKVPGQTKIVFIVAEGTTVKQGDVLVSLDSTGLEELIALHQLEATQARAKLQQAEAELQSIKLDGELQIKVAEIVLDLSRSEKDRELGEGGELAVEHSAVESEITIATARLKTARFLLDRVEADPLRAEEMRLRITEARESLKVAETRKRFLDGPQRKHKTVVRDLAIAEGAAKLERHKSHLSRSVEGATAEVIAQQAAFDHVRQNLDRVKELLRHFQIVAPQDGMVVYPNTSGRRASASELKAGASVQERQILVRLADLGQLQLKFYVDEADIDRLRVDQPATVKIDAFPNKTSSGKVTAVSAVAESPNRAESDVRQYAVIVALDDPPAQAKLGMTAIVEIQVGAEKTE